MQYQVYYSEEKADFEEIIVAVIAKIVEYASQRVDVHIFAM